MDCLEDSELAVVPWVTLENPLFLYISCYKKFSFLHDLTAVWALLSGRGFPRGGHTFGRANFPRGRGFYPRVPGHGGRMGFVEHQFGSSYPPIRGRSNFGRGNESNKLCFFVKNENDKLHIPPPPHTHPQKKLC